MKAEYSIQPLDKTEWRRLAGEFEDYNYRQVWDYGQETAKNTNSKSESVAIMAGAQIIGIANVRIKTLPIFPTGIAYINGGPVLRRKGGSSDDSSLFRQALCALKQEYVDNRNLVLRVICPIGAESLIEDQTNIFTEMDFKPSQGVKSYRTMLVDLTRTEEELRKGLAQKWRNCLNRSERNELRVLKGTDDAMFEKFQSLFDELRERKWFDVVLGPDFFRHLQGSLHESEKYVIHLVEAEGVPIAGHVGSFIGDTGVYLLGAANQAGNKLMASYLMQWRVMLHAQERGCRWYDLGGVDADENPGVYRFKQRMGGQEVSAAGPCETGPLVAGYLVSASEKLYRKVRRNRR